MSGPWFEFAGVDWRAHLIWAIPLLAALAVRAARRRRTDLAAYGKELFPATAPGIARRRTLRITLTLLGLLALYAALLQPRTDPVKRPVKARVRDLAVCLDVSRSMLADDLAPSRLERAKLELSRLVDSLEGDRIGLVVFAGEAVVQCPLTSNYSYFKSALRNVTERSASQGGTRIGDALRKALADLLGLDLTGSAGNAEGGAEGDAGEELAAIGPEALERFADILLITDGEDQESYPVYAARSCRSLGVGLYVIGLGSEEGHSIPIERDGVSEV
ncbi:MAG: VWA domain-containing protein, partial [Planctomycetota bacterium]